jgi:hypothetical protein
LNSFFWLQKSFKSIITFHFFLGILILNEIIDSIGTALFEASYAGNVSHKNVGGLRKSLCGFSGREGSMIQLVLQSYETQATSNLLKCHFIGVHANLSYVMFVLFTRLTTMLSLMLQLFYDSILNIFLIPFEKFLLFFNVDRVHVRTIGTGT